MYKFWYDYIKPKCGDKAKLCYMDTDNFIIHIKTEDFYEDIADDIGKWFDTSNYDKNDKKPLPVGKNKKVIGLVKDELGGTIMTKFCVLRGKTWAYLMDDGSEHKKDRGTKKCVIKRTTMFENYIDCLFNNKIILKSQQVFRSNHYDLYMQKSIRLR